MYLIIGLLCCLACAICIAACGGHEHTYSDEWSSDENEHWRAAVCEHVVEIADKGAHEFDGLSCAVCGYAIPGTQGLEYSLSSDGSGYSVIGIGNVKEAEIEIPYMYNGLPVTGIGSNAFYYCGFIESLSFPKALPT